MGSTRPARQSDELKLLYMSEWIPVSEKPLPFGEVIIVAADSYMGKFVAVATVGKCEHHFVSVEGVSGWEVEVDFQYSDITHWMPAPEFPN